MIKVTKKKEKCLAEIAGEMTIYNAAEFKDALAPLLDEPRAIEINLSKVSEMDTAGVQLLMLAKRERQRSGLAISLNKHSKAVLDAFELFNLVPYFNDPVMLARKRGEKHGS